MKSGIYCLDTYMQPCERGMWKDYQEPQGVLVMKDNYGIILPPALPFIAAWGVPGFNDDLITDEPDLVIPHPDMENRDFVLIPLKEIAPYKIHPLLHKRIKDL